MVALLVSFCCNLLADDEFENLCFEIGVELEYGTGEEMQMNRVDGNGTAIDITKEIVYKIEVAANRYDLLCIEGIATAFRAYLDISHLPRYEVQPVSEMREIIVKSETKSVRPFVVGCVLRDVTLDIKAYNSFIDLQDKLHQNICRRRYFASMGTHDLDKIAPGPITYEAQKPEDIVFKALKQTEEMNASALFEVFKKDIKMKKFLPLLESHEKYPVFYDSDRKVLSLPPIINSEATKITTDTKNIFIEITGLDLIKTKVCLAILASQFSEYSAGDWKHKVEQVKITYEGEPDKNEITPTQDYIDFEVEVSYINRVLGIDIDSEKASECARKMGLLVKKVSDDKNLLTVEVPPTRSDILHKCDVAEDIGIGFGFNNIAKIYPSTNTVGSYQPNNKFADLLRQELAQAGYTECMTFSLLSLKDNYERMRLPTNLDEAVQLSNPKTLEFEVVRTSLLPGILRCLQSNKKETIPQQAFELSDCCVLAPGSEIGAKNVRMVCAAVIDQTANFQAIHGLLDLLMVKIGAKFQQDYKLAEDNSDPRFFPSRGVAISLNGKKIGSMGVLHPEVLNNFELKYPVCALELDFDSIKDHFLANNH